IIICLGFTPSWDRSLFVRLIMMKRKRETVVALKHSRLQAETAPEANASAGKTPDHDLERAIPYLLARAGMRMGQSFSKELKQFNLSLTEWRVCVALHHKEHQRLSDLASHTST